MVEHGQLARTQSQSQGKASVLAADLHIDGTLSSQGLIRVHASLNGDISGPTVVIEENAVIRGDVTADRVEIHGQVTGDVAASEVTILATARLSGIVTYGRITVAAGGSVEGELRRQKPIAVLPEPAGAVGK